ncbi:helix-turn-helix domain-containing protein [Pseudomonas sp. R3.Fl]|uniref:helix-turn-helix domain-containing protein n=1 Tax=Pseudomonas sp. R3.Fl TaxID=2928708 RepID=UPI00201D450F|nr:helix-turn-helix transcriptional regulator [Pseudomonas sp. R3.Fl]MCL6691345.1 helix-turn-helix domain-containing protein [Pseudomonas sp. R3.Fl]
MLLLQRVIGMSVLGSRIKQARMRVGLSQERLGLEAGLDEMSASARMNRYELGKRIPTPDFVERLGLVLGVPAAYFYSTEEDEAELLTKFHQLEASKRIQLLQYLDELLAS